MLERMALLSEKSSFGQQPNKLKAIFILFQQMAKTFVISLLVQLLDTVFEKGEVDFMFEFFYQLLPEEEFCVNLSWEEGGCKQEIYPILRTFFSIFLQKAV